MWKAAKAQLVVGDKPTNIFRFVGNKHMPNFDKIINLLKKTGDRAIILDENGEPSYVVMTVSGYEQLILGKSEVKGLTEEELLAKINRDIAIWQESQKKDDLAVDQRDFSEDLGEFGDLPKEIEEDRYYIEPVE